MQPTNQQQFIMKSKFNIALVGGRGYVGQEIIGILNNHPNFTLSKIFSKSASGDAVKEYTKISGQIDSCDDREELRNIAKCFCKLYYKQQETMHAIGIPNGI